MSLCDDYVERVKSHKEMKFDNLILMISYARQVRWLKEIKLLMATINGIELATVGLDRSSWTLFLFKSFCDDDNEVPKSCFDLTAEHMVMQQFVGTT